RDGYNRESGTRSKRSQRSGDVHRHLAPRQRRGVREVRALRSGPVHGIGYVPLILYPVSARSTPVLRGVCGPLFGGWWAPLGIEPGSQATRKLFRSRSRLGGNDVSISPKPASGLLSLFPTLS